MEGGGIKRIKDLFINIIDIFHRIKDDMISLFFREKKEMAGIQQFI